MSTVTCSVRQLSGGNFYVGSSAYGSQAEGKRDSMLAADIGWRDPFQRNTGGIYSPYPYTVYSCYACGNCCDCAADHSVACSFRNPYMLPYCIAI